MFLPFAIKPASIHAGKKTGRGEKQIQLIFLRNQTMSSVTISSELAETSETPSTPTNCPEGGVGGRVADQMAVTPTWKQGQEAKRAGERYI